MPTLENLKKELKAVQELSDISGALEQIAAKTMLNTRENILKSREFFDETWRVYGVLKKLVPFTPEVKNKELVVVITINRGMCGNLLNKVIKVGEQMYNEHKADLLITGKKGQSYFAKKSERTIHFFSLPNELKYQEIEPLKKILAEYAQVHIVFPRYHSISKQEVEAVSLIAGDEKKPVVYNDESAVLPEQFRIEPNITEVVNHFNETIMGIMLFNYFSESLLAYNAAQMVAMRNAHDNTQTESKRLNFKLHKKYRELIDTKMRDIHKIKREIKGE